MKNILLVLSGFVIIGCSSARKNNEVMKTKLSIIEMNDDIKFVENNLFKMHPDVDWYISNEKLHYKFDSLSKTITEPLKPNDFYLKIAPIISEVHQGHMSLSLLTEEIEKENKKKYKGSKGPISQFEYLWKNNKLFIKKNNSQDSTIFVGSEIVSINDITPQVLFQKYRPTFTSDGFNQTFIDKWFERKIPSYYGSEIGIKDTIDISLSCLDSIYSRKITRIFKIEKDSKKVKSKSDSLALKKKDSLDSKKNQLTKEEKKTEKEGLRKVEKRKSVFGYDEDKKEYVISLTYPKKDSSLAVLKIRKFAESKYKKAYDTIFKEIKENKVQHLVLDLRGNTGGRLNEIDKLYSYLIKDKEYVFLKDTEVTSKWQLPIHVNRGHSVWNYIFLSPFYLIQSPIMVLKTEKIGENKFNYRMKSQKKQKQSENFYDGELFVLTDGLSFSASSIISSNLKGTKRAIFVGEETGGTYNGTVAGRMPVLKLPNSKLKWKLGVMSINPINQTEEFGRGIKPDIEITPTLEQIINKEDPEMEWIFNKLNIK